MLCISYRVVTKLAQLRTWKGQLAKVVLEGLFSKFSSVLLVEGSEVQGVKQPVGKALSSSRNIGTFTWLVNAPDSGARSCAFTWGSFLYTKE